MNYQIKINLLNKSSLGKYVIFFILLLIVFSCLTIEEKKAELYINEANKLFKKREISKAFDQLENAKSVAPDYYPTKVAWNDALENLNLTFENFVLEKRILAANELLIILKQRNIDFPEKEKWTKKITELKHELDIYWRDFYRLLDLDKTSYLISTNKQDIIKKKMDDAYEILDNILKVGGKEQADKVKLAKQKVKTLVQRTKDRDELYDFIEKTKQLFTDVKKNYLTKGNQALDNIEAISIKYQVTSSVMSALKVLTDCIENDSECKKEDLINNLKSALKEDVVLDSLAYTDHIKPIIEKITELSINNETNPNK